MKKVYFLTLLALIISSQIFAQKQINSGSFQFAHTDTKNKQIVKIQLESNQKIEESDVSNILIVNLFPGEYNVTVHYRFHNVLQNASQKIIIESGKRVVCTLNENNMLSFSYKIDNSSMPLSLDTNVFNAILDLQNKVLNTTIDLAKETQGTNNQQNNNSNNQNTSSQNTHNERGGHQSGRHNQKQEPKPVSESDFNNLLNSAKSEKFEDSKIQSIKSSADFHQYFTSEQVKRLINILSHESSKYEVAIYLANKVLDKQNLPLIKDVFRHSSTKEEFLDFIKTLK